MLTWVRMKHFLLFYHLCLTILREELLLYVLKKHKKVMGWQISDIKGIIPIVCMHKISLEENAKNTIERVTIITNDNEELIPTRIVTGWRICMDYID
ncbi:hypothetical protein MTR_5g021680 [Medicago truncatula]|uniref:Transmembrane protein n=1 Tax=Medicago truncatula TaxID=3880 RepID=G7KGF2_MEDTR|nr:hypothetical protein MTR_5g021680 [Medicago truncatula]